MCVRVCRFNNMSYFTLCLQNMFDMLIEMLSEYNDTFTQLHYDTWHLVTNKILDCIRQILEDTDAGYGT